MLEFWLERILIPLACDGKESERKTNGVAERTFT